MTRLAWALAGVVVALQIAYPLLSGRALQEVTIAAVLAFAAASLASAGRAHGARGAVVLALVAGGVGLLAEAVGVGTGVPFGRYAYTGTLGPQVLGVPVVVPAAWAMMAWPALVAGRRIAAAAGRPWLVVPCAAWALASWDLFLDPQMVAAGHWRWAHPSPSLPGVPGIPLTNFAGWLVVALAIQSLLHATLTLTAARAPASARARSNRGDGAGTQGPVAVLLGWTWLGSTVANAAFFARPGVAAWGFAAMGLVVGPHLLLLARDRRARALPPPALAPAAR